MLKRIQAGDVAGGAQRLDLLLCDDLLQINSQLEHMEPADNAQQAYTQRMFGKIAQLRPGNAVITAGSARELYADQVEAEKLLALAVARNPLGNNTVAASH